MQHLAVSLTLEAVLTRVRETAVVAEKFHKDFEEQAMKARDLAKKTNLSQNEQATLAKNLEEILERLTEADKL